MEKGKSGHLDNVYSQKVNAGKRRTYFFDVKETQGEDFYITITESTRRADGNGYNRHKIFLYKEDFNKFIKALNEAVDYVKTDIMPDFDFDAFNHEYPEGEEPVTNATPVEEDAEKLDDKIAEPVENNFSLNSNDTEDVEKW